MAVRAVLVFFGVEGIRGQLGAAFANTLRRVLWCICRVLVGGRSTYVLLRYSPAKLLAVPWAKERMGLREKDPDNVWAVMECDLVDLGSGGVWPPCSAMLRSCAKSLSLTVSPVNGNWGSPSRRGMRRGGMVAPAYSDEDKQRNGEGATTEVQERSSLDPG